MSIVPSGPLVGRPIDFLIGSEAERVYESTAFEAMAVADRRAIVRKICLSRSIENYIGEGDHYSKVQLEFIEFAARRGPRPQKRKVSQQWQD